MCSVHCESNTVYHSYVSNDWLVLAIQSSFVLVEERVAPCWYPKLVTSQQQWSRPGATHLFSWAKLFPPQTLAELSLTPPERRERNMGEWMMVSAFSILSYISVYSAVTFLSILLVLRRVLVFLVTLLLLINFNMHGTFDRVHMQLVFYPVVVCNLSL